MIIMFDVFVGLFFFFINLILAVGFWKAQACTETWEYVSVGLIASLMIATGVGGIIVFVIRLLGIATWLVLTGLWAGVNMLWDKVIDPAAEAASELW